MQKRIRNFSIIAHIDHGKSTLSDRIIEICKNKKLKKNEVRILDSMDIEKEKGITIKSQSINLKYKLNKNKYIFNLIDTPGHIDFSYEVSRSLYGCEGVLLLIDVTQGIEAQTLTNYNIANHLKLKIITIINKIDLLRNNVNNIKKQIEKTLKIKKEKIILCSAKTGEGINEIIKNIIKYIPSPQGDSNAKLEALIIDSYFNNYLGILFLIKIKNGSLKQGDKLIKVGDKKSFIVEQIFIQTPKKVIKRKLFCGEIAWISCNIKSIKNTITVGNTLTLLKNPTFNKVTKFKKIQSQIYAKIYPIENNDFLSLKKSIKKLNLNDPSLVYEIENSTILGLGFKCGFLGLFHIEIIKERLKREYNLDIIITQPTVTYKVINKKNQIIYINNPSEMFEQKYIKKIKEPYSICIIISPIKYLGKIIKLCIKKRGTQKEITFNKKNVIIKYKLPLIEIITNFIDKLKSISNGYASFEYYFYKFQTSNIVILDILINKKKINELSTIIHKNNIYYYGKKIIETIKNSLSKHQFNITIQSCCNNKIIAKTNIKALRKNVTSKCYGGDITRKKKLLQKQKEGKKKLRKIGNINIPSITFLNILKIK